MDSKDVSVKVGVGIVIITHVYMLYAGLPEEQHAIHAYINLAAAGLILYGCM
jgi:hypothetical protein